MRSALLAILLALPSAASAQAIRPPAPAAPAAKAAPAIGCPSLANLRFLMRQSGNDVAAAGATLADPKADHLSCVVLAPEKVGAVTDHVALSGRAYDCLAMQGTTVCHWVMAGSVAPAEPAKPGLPAKAAPARR